MDYPAAAQYLESLIDYERTPERAAAARAFNLARMEALLGRLDHPQAGLKCLHIAGTKGKGSIAAMAASILSCRRQTRPGGQAAGYRVGLYTSPHLVSFRERIRVDDALIPESRVAALTARLRPHLEALRLTEAGPPSFFEAYTALAFLHFAEQKVDFAVLETGLGGRLDATNVVIPLVCGLARIGLDHTQELGDTLKKIAAEKAGIIKPRVPVVCAPQPPEAMEVIAAVCREKGSLLLTVGDLGDDCAIGVKASPPTEQGQAMTIRGRRGLYEGLVCPLLGEHQAWNAGVAVGMVELLAEQGFRVEAAAIEAGLAQVRWPGRFQIITGLTVRSSQLSEQLITDNSQRAVAIAAEPQAMARRRLATPRIVLDGAHDVLSAQTLARTAKALFPESPLTLVLGVCRDKDIEGIAAALLPVAQQVVLTATKSPRSAGVEELRQGVAALFPNARLSCAPDAAAALEQARVITGKDGIILVTGSLYLVGEVMQVLSLES